MNLPRAEYDDRARVDPILPFYLKLCEAFAGAVVNAAPSRHVRVFLSVLVDDPVVAVIVRRALSHAFVDVRENVHVGIRVVVKDVLAGGEISRPRRSSMKEGLARSFSRLTWRASSAVA